MTSVQEGLLGHLRHAAAAYGAEFPLPGATNAPIVATSGPATAEGEPPLAPEPAPVVVETPPTEAPADPAARLASLQAEVSPCTKCNLHKGRTHVVFGEGNPTARVMFVGEAPGQVEDETGRPFVGPSGQLLDKIIENAMGMAREDVFIANVNKCRPPGNRDPEPLEIASCLPWLRSQIKIIKPEVIVVLGRVAMWNLLGVTESLSRMRGRTLLYEDTPVIATWHPAYLLRNPSAKGQTWEDIKRVNRVLGNPDVPSRRETRRESGGA